MNFSRSGIRDVPLLFRMLSHLLLIFCALSAPLVAAVEKPTSIIQEIIITPSSSQDLTDQAAVLLTADALERRAAATLGDTLRHQPGIASAGFGPGVGQPVLRGHSGNRVKVVQNGLDILDASAISGDHAVATEALLAQRIEVLRGPAALRYGGGALGGVINVVDNRIPEQLAEKVSTAIEFRHGSGSDQNIASGSLDGGLASLGWHLDSIYRDSNNLDIPGAAAREESGGNRGFVGNTQTQAHATAVGASWFSAAGFIGLGVQQLDYLYGIPSAPEDAEQQVRIDMAQTRYELKGEWRPPAASVTALRLDAAYTDYRHIELENGEPGTRFANDAFTARAELTYPSLGEWDGAAGLEIGHRQLSAVGEEAFIPSVTVRKVGLYWITGATWDNWRWSAGARLDREQVSPEQGPHNAHTATSLSASGSRYLNPLQELRFTASRVQRAPSVEELFSFGPHLATNSFDIGNRRLDVETNHEVELGYHQRGKLSVDASVFFSHVKNFISKFNSGAVDPETGLPIFYFNADRATFAGMEFSLRRAVTEHVTLGLFGDAIRAQLTDDDVPRIPPPRAGLSLDWAAGNWQAGFQFATTSRQRYPGRGESTTSGHGVLDVHLEHKLLSSRRISYRTFLRISNLLDQEVRSATSFLRDIAPEPGRNIELGIGFTF